MHQLANLLVPFSFLLTLFSCTHAQQWAGEIIPNHLKQTEGSEISYFNIRDEDGANTTLINWYHRPKSTGQRIVTSKVKRAVVVVHGSLRNGNDYFTSAYESLKKVMASHSDITDQEVAIMAPYFANGLDKNIGYPWVDGRPAGEGSNTSVLVWQGSGWADGERNIYPHEHKTVSSFDAMDQILQYFDNRSLFPNLHQIVVAGHSLGAQTVQRYAGVGKQLQLKTPITYWIGNPNSYLWFNDQRPESTKNCPDYNDWRNGLDKYTNMYERDFVQNGRDNGAVLGRWHTRDIILARGLSDFGDDSSGCGPETQGPDRGNRTANFIKAFRPDMGDMVDYVPGVGHNHAQMMSSESGQTRLFIDNFSGDKSRHADFGPRQTTGDDPHPTSTTSDNSLSLGGILKNF